jgi:diaminohydroxyphosphoribosylaminopyrimidine deaminase/5-amino-6-(5-phosphoribosylamino)uracil reductase
VSFDLLLISVKRNNRQTDFPVSFFFFFRFMLALLLAILSAIMISGDEVVDGETDTKSAIHAITEQLQHWQSQRSPSRSQRPFVTLSFAQSLNGKLAAIVKDETGETSSNYPLSGDKALMLTHAVRSMHDAILVGGRTLLIDNPRLTNRLWGDGEGKQPRPIVLDTHLEYIQTLGESCRCQNLLVCCSEEAAAAASLETLTPYMQVLPCKCTKDGKLDLLDVLHKLKNNHGFESLMVEGGAAALSSFVNENLVDCLCITISPKMLANGIAPSLLKDLALPSPRFIPLGSDCILLSSWSN